MRACAFCGAQSGGDAARLCHTDEVRHYSERFFYGTRTPAPVIA
jgi:hypothetical protein